MKTLPLILAATLLLGAFLLRVESQGFGEAKTPLQQLQALKAENAKLLDRQAATLLKFDEVQKDASQMRIFASKG